MIADPALAMNEDRQARPEDAVAVLHTRTVDALTGFVTMVEKAEPHFRSVAEEFRSLHAFHAERLARILTELGVEADEDGSFFGSVNKTVVTLRALFDEIDEDVMDQVRSGEKHVLSAFDKALKEDLLPAHHAAIREMRKELTDLIARTDHLD